MNNLYHKYCQFDIIKSQQQQQQQQRATTQSAMRCFLRSGNPKPQLKTEILMKNTHTKKSAKKRRREREQI